MFFENISSFSHDVQNEPPSHGERTPKSIAFQFNRNFEMGLSHHYHIDSFVRHSIAAMSNVNVIRVIHANNPIAHRLWWYELLVH